MALKYIGEGGDNEAQLADLERGNSQEEGGMRKLGIMLIALLTLAVVIGAVGCGDDGPSEKDIKKAVWDWVRVRQTTYVSSPYNDVQEVEVIKIGSAYKIGDMKVWPVRVYLVKPNSKIEKALDLSRNQFGEWFVW